MQFDKPYNKGYNTWKTTRCSHVTVIWVVLFHSYQSPHSVNKHFTKHGYAMHTSIHSQAALWRKALFIKACTQHTCRLRVTFIGQPQSDRVRNKLRVLVLLCFNCSTDVVFCSRVSNSMRTLHILTQVICLCHPTDSIERLPSAFPSWWQNSRLISYDDLNFRLYVNKIN